MNAAALFLPTRVSRFPEQALERDRRVRDYLRSMRHVPPSAPAACLVRVAILDDYFDTLHTLPCFARLAPFDVTIFDDHVQDVTGSPSASPTWRCSC